MTYSEFIEQTIEKNVEEHVPNGLKVSETNNPFVFLAKHTYQIGSSEIVSMCSNAIAVGSGQTGSAPLYVFCKDGIYALFVDASGELAYTNSRIIARDVCNNAKSVTPIDTGVVFTTDRGLMKIAGNEVKEIGQSVEGNFLDITDDKITDNAYHMVKLGNLPSGSEQSVDFLMFIKNSIVNYNHNERELMVSNILRYTDDEDLAEANPDKFVYDEDEDISGKPVYNYTYIMDRDGNWSRRNYTADEYINNYPTSYRLKDGLLYQVDEESDVDNSMFLCSREIKLDSIGFKELNRVVARGSFETGKNPVYKTIPAVDTDTYASYSPAIVKSLRTDTISASVGETLMYNVERNHSYGSLGISPTNTHQIKGKLGDLENNTCVIDVDDLQQSVKLNIGATFLSNGTPSSAATISLKFVINKSLSNTRFKNSGNSHASFALRLADSTGTLITRSLIFIKSVDFQKTDDYTLTCNISLKETYDILANFPNTKYIIPICRSYMSGVELEYRSLSVDSYKCGFTKKNVSIPVSRYEYGRFGTLDEDCYRLGFLEDGLGHDYKDYPVQIGESAPFTVNQEFPYLNGYLRDGQAKYGVSSRGGIQVCLHTLEGRKKFHFATSDVVQIKVQLYDTDAESIVCESSTINCRVRSGGELDIIDFEDGISKMVVPLEVGNTYKLCYMFEGALVHAVLSPEEIAEEMQMPSLCFENSTTNEVVELVAEHAYPRATIDYQYSSDNTMYKLAEHYHKDAYVVIDKYEDAYIGIYVYGSYDARKWTLIGHKEKIGTFNDIGCLVERTDCKFFRIVMAGGLKKSSKFDYFEISSKQSKLYHKIR